MRLCVVLPACNEAENLAPMFEGFRKVAAESGDIELSVLLVDDGSTDGTSGKARALAEGLKLDVLVNERNLGLAETFLRGITTAVERAEEDDVILCMDADNSHLPSQIPAVARAIREGRDVVIVSRYRPGAVVRGVSRLRRFLSWGMSILCRVVYPISGVRDYSCGYRGYRAGALRKALASGVARCYAQDGFACMLAMLLRLAKQGAVFGEIPIELRYDRKRGGSKMKVMRTVFRTFRVLLRERFAST